MSRIIINSNYRVSTAEIGLTTVNKQLFDNIYVEETNEKVTVSFRVKSTLEEAAKWEITGPDSLYIVLSQQNNPMVLWVNWVEPNDQFKKGFCIPMHNVEWMKYDNNQ